MAHGVCMQLAPNIFVPDEDGYVALAPGRESSDDEPRVRLAAESCPMQAILLATETPGGSGAEAGARPTPTRSNGGTT
jgi:ferredoxin